MLVRKLSYWVLPAAALLSSCGKTELSTSSTSSIIHEKQFFLVQGETLWQTECPEGRVSIRENCFDAVPEHQRRPYRFSDVKAYVAQNIAAEARGYEAKKKALIDEAREKDDDIRVLTVALVEARSAVGRQSGVVEESKKQRDLAKAAVLLNERDLNDLQGELTRIAAEIKETGGHPDLLKLQKHRIAQQAEVQTIYEANKATLLTAEDSVTGAEAQLSALNARLNNADSGLRLARTNFYPKPTYPRYEELRGYEGHLLRLSGLAGEVSKRVYDYMEESGISYLSELLDEKEKSFIKDYFFPLTQRCRRIH